MADEVTDPFAGFNTVKSDGQGGAVAADPPKKAASEDKSEDSGKKAAAPNPLAEFSDDGEGDQDDVHDENEDDVLDGDEDELQDDEDGGEAAEDDDDEDDESGDEDSGDGEGEDRRPPSKAKRRIGELTKARRDAERRAEAAERRVAELEAAAKPAQKDEDAGGDDDPPPAEIVVKGADGKELKEPDPKDYDYGEVDSRYLKDVIDYQTAYAKAKVEADAEETRKAEAADAQRQEIQQQWASTLERGAEAHDDFEEVVLESAERDEWSLTKTMFEIASASELGHEMLYHLAQNPKQSDKIAKMDELDQARYLGRLEAALETAQKGSDKGKQKRKAPGAEPPPRRRTPRGKGGKFVNPAKGSFADFEAAIKRQEQRQQSKR